MLQCYASECVALNILTHVDRMTAYLPFIHALASWCHLLIVSKDMHLLLSHSLRQRWLMMLSSSSFSEKATVLRLGGSCRILCKWSAILHNSRSRHPAGSGPKQPKASMQSAKYAEGQSAWLRARFRKSASHRTSSLSKPRWQDSIVHERRSNGEDQGVRICFACKGGRSKLHL